LFPGILGYLKVYTYCRGGGGAYHGEAAACKRQLVTERAVYKLSMSVIQRYLSTEKNLLHLRQTIRVVEAEFLTTKEKTVLQILFDAFQTTDELQQTTRRLNGLWKSFSISSFSAFNPLSVEENVRSLQ